MAASLRAELKKHQREAAIKATQKDAHVQCTVLVEINFSSASGVMCGLGTLRKSGSESECT
jgi:hypothetical protein